MHVVGIVGELHLLFRRDPMLVRLEDRLCLLRVHQPIAVGWLHGPRLRVDDIRALERLVHVVDDLEGATVLLGQVLGRVEHIRVEVEPLGVGERHVHSHHRCGDDRALRNSQRLLHRAGISPAHDELLALQVVSQLLLHRHHVGQRLTWMIHVVFHVDHGDPRPLGELAYDQVSLAVFPSGVLAVDADGDGIPHLGQDACHIGYAFGRVRLLLSLEGRRVDGSRLQEVGVPTELGHTRLKRVARAQAGVVEQHVQCVIRENVMLLPTDLLALQFVCRVEHHLDLIARKI